MAGADKSAPASLKKKCVVSWKEKGVASGEVGYFSVLLRVLSGVSLCRLANALGPLLGTELGVRFGYQVCFFLSTSLFAIAIFLVLGLLGEKVPFRSEDDKGFLFVFFPASGAAFLSMICLAFVHSLGMLVLAAVFLASGQCSLTVLIQSEGVRHVPKEYVGRASNTLFLGPDIGMFLGPAIGGIVLQTAGPSALFFANAGIILSMVLLSFAAKAVTKRK